MSDSDDDEIADLFSFSAASPATEAQPNADSESNKSTAEKESLSTNVATSASSAAASTDAISNDTPDGMKGLPEEDEEDLFGPQPIGRSRTDTSDSVLGLLDQDETDLVVLSSSAEETEGLVEEAQDAPIQSSDTQEILDWLDKPSTTAEKTDADGEKQKETDEEKSSPADPTESNVDNKETSEEQSKDPTEDDAKPDPPELGSPFVTLEEAIASPHSTMDQIRRLFIKSKFHLHPRIRPYLWCRSVCGKPLEQVRESSNADSYIEWEKEYSEHGTTHVKERIKKWILKESSILADRIVAVVDHNNKQCLQQEDDEDGDGLPPTVTNVTLEQATKELTCLLLFHYQSSNTSTDKEVDLDPLLPPVACALLTAGIPTAVASVMLSNIVPTFMPLLALANTERLEASRPLHTQFYLLASYHLPLLVHHLDRYLPGWYWPKVNTSHGKEDNATLRNRNLESQGLIPQSWFISHLAGECDGTLMNPKWLVALWDLILISNNNSLRFFFSLALLEKNSDTLLMVTGDTLRKELERILEFKEETTLEGFAIEPEEESSSQEAVDWVQEWCDCARNLWESTPKSVTLHLRAAEDEAVSTALVQRQQAKEVALQERLELEAKEHVQAVQAEKERKMDEARAKLTRARLVAYYRKYNPEKEDTVDKILKTFDGRLEVLDAKLKKKYGEGFNPALRPKQPEKNKLLSTMNQSINETKRRMADALAKRNSDSQLTGFEDQHHEVTVAVSPAEVLPVLCWSKQSGSTSRGRQILAKRQQRLKGNDQDDEERIPIKFFLVDSRPADTCLEQGRFPTAANLSPETLLDPDRIQQLEETFESLRGAVHICVMGEGFSAVPELYGQKMNSKLQELIKEDDSRTSLCALFLVKKGFPFVSILDGGFAAAHAWLSREGPKQGLDPNTALVDYNAGVSLFAQLEDAYREHEAMASASTREKTQHAMQNLFDGSLASLTRSQQRLEQISFKIEQERIRKSMSNIFGKKQPNKSGESNSKADRRQSEVRQSVSKLFSKKASKPEPTVASPEKEGAGRDDMESQTSETVKPNEESSRFSLAGLADSIKKDRDAKDEGEGGSEVNRFRNPFARKNDEKDKVATIDATPSTTEPSVSIANSFAKLKQVASSPRSSTSEEQPKSEESGEEEVEASSSASKGMKNRFAGFGVDTQAAGGKKNRFAGLGSALGAAKRGSSTQPRRNNPFARFGGAGGAAFAKQGDANTTDETTGDGAVTNRFANLGMNQLRKMRANSKKHVQEQDTTDDIVMIESTEVVEESISFFDGDDDDVEVVDIDPQQPST